MKEVDWLLFEHEQRDRGAHDDVLFSFELLWISSLFYALNSMFGSIWSAVYGGLLPILEREKGVKKRERKEVFFS